MTMGVFVQVNEGSRYAKSHPLGYVIEENGCWEWVGHHTRDGYGTVFHHGKSGQKAHRMMYEKCVGAIPAGLELDHKCRNRGCVNPAHLEPVDNRTNALRGVGWTAQQARKTHCKYGHPLSGGNLKPNIYGRRCFICERRRGRESYYAAKARKNLDLGGAE